MGRNNDGLNGLPARIDRAVTKTAKGIPPVDPAKLAKSVKNTAKKRGR
jgi:hypothetical protein